MLPRPYPNYLRPSKGTEGEKKVDVVWNGVAIVVEITALAFPPPFFFVNLKWHFGRLGALFEDEVELYRCYIKLKLKVKLQLLHRFVNFNYTTL